MSVYLGSVRKFMPHQIIEIAVFSVKVILQGRIHSASCQIVIFSAESGVYQIHFGFRGHLQVHFVAVGGSVYQMNLYRTVDLLQRQLCQFFLYSRRITEAPCIIHKEIQLVGLLSLRLLAASLGFLSAVLTFPGFLPAVLTSLRFLPAARTAPARSCIIIAAGRGSKYHGNA